MTRDDLRLLFPDGPYWGGRTHGQQMPPKECLIQTAFVSRVASDRKPLRVLEVGSWTGFSALTWAHAIAHFSGSGEVLCVDPWRPYFSAQDEADGLAIYADMQAALSSGLAYALFLHNTGFGPKSVPIKHHRGYAAEFLPTLTPGAFDIVFIDGSHYYEDVLRDTRIAQQLVSEGGLLIGDDLELQIEDAAINFVRANLSRDYVQDPRTGLMFHPGVTLAVGEIMGRVSTKGRFWYAQRRGDDFVPLPPGSAEVYACPHWPRKDAKPS